MRTRSQQPAGSSGTNQETCKPALPAPSKPTKTLILPCNATDDARFILLENPRSGALGRYYFCPKLGLYEFTAISSSAVPRSILFTPTAKCTTSSATDKQEINARNTSSDIAADDVSAEKNEIIQQVVENQALAKATIAKEAQLLVATPVDILFFLLPILVPARGNSASRKHFQPLDDMIDSQDTLSATLKHVFSVATFRERVEARMIAVCDTVEAGETMYRLNEDKLLKELISKAERMAAGGLPPSLEERFIHRALELPVLSVKRHDLPTTSTSSNPSDVADDTNNTVENSPDKPESQSSASFAASVVSTPNTIITPPIDNSPSNCDVHHLLRVRTSISFLQSSYLPKHLSSRIETLLSSPETSPKDFSPLTQHLKLVAELRAKALASRSMSDFSRKRGTEDDEEVDIRAEKKRKEEQEKKKRMGESRAVRDLKKVNVSGMKKLSSFFQKKT
ncbi:hypothetical protein RJZ56_002103 [Blastomyces dermatitidis]|uniref:Ribonuclease H2 subunit B n=3 Tax=Blastomyces TaxID=229219 RepID=A0A179URB7_BLAGS|nr:uncharacterized protein BDBG_06378 [Blastomyces gilchristii SLH14081]XP_045271973.1 uncharacterized protein BDCG_00678 [Blastomyces dermatitidis ER-3]EGE80208.1 hypothetical protein BDDG_03149 [Blastomyces dermatitidis ATCC 18188]EQL37364.1 hypothetical protein BDFG_01326 [Blastomyces dermatitidis ATCC 26199]EEQ83873.1 hypothetical protein BDCG_00678 [Blastomyces dermatitidis ER-3]OAT10554.1 hypothetical protein BDBG_06378 [Blastomyces gilchristii SLH14081]